MSYSYDNENIFAKILRGEIPCEKVHETEHALAFKDINPAAPVHVLVIPKGAYVAYDHFALEASEAEILDFTRAVAEVAKITGVSPMSGGGGFRALCNAGADSMQEVPHFHVHLLGGKKCGPILAPEA